MVWIYFFIDMWFSVWSSQMQVFVWAWDQHRLAPSCASAVAVFLNQTPGQSMCCTHCVRHTHTAVPFSMPEKDLACPQYAYVKCSVPKKYQCSTATCWLHVVSGYPDPQSFAQIFEQEGKGSRYDM